MSLRLDWCSHKAAKYAVEHWHYSKIMPRTKLLKIGVWEDNKFIGCLIFNNSANNNLGKPYGLGQKQVAELVRVALRKHSNSVSKMIAIAIRMLKRQSPGLRLLVSFADTEHNHHGGIYQAGNWLYAGMTQPADEYMVNGKRYQGRALRATRESSRRANIHCSNVLEWAQKVLDPHAYQVQGSSKHRYLMPLDKEMAERIRPLAKPYPKRAVSDTSDTAVIHTAKGGAAPTAALQE